MPRIPVNLVLGAAVCAIVLTTNVRLLARGTSDEFLSEGVHFLQQYCFECHAGEAPEADLSLDAFETGEHLFRNRATADKILEALRFGIMPPAEAKQPPRRDVDMFINRVERTLEEAALKAPPDPGRVTMRRLNRTEYAHTIRVLLGVDFNPRADFPADEVGYGFDNIGDVLMLSPLLMERYLTAAESIVERALAKEPPIPPQRVVPSQHTEPYGFDDAEAQFRPMSSEQADDPVRGGPIFVTFDVPPGEYRLRTRLAATAPPEQLVRVAVLACGREWEDRQAGRELVDQLSGSGWESLGPFRLLKTVEVKSRTTLFALDEVIEIPEIPGFNRIAFALYRPAADEKPVTAHLGWLRLDGPLSREPCLFRRQVDELAAGPPAERTRNLVTWLLRRAYRRPPTDGEIARLVLLVEQVESEGGTWVDGVALALQAVLVSPKFLFRAELDADPHSPDPRPVDEFQLASRLSYFLWSTMPDDELLALAEEGRLRDNLDQQLERMLADPRADALVDNFVIQWLQLEKLERVAPDRELFPTFDDALRAAMLEETRLFAQSILREDRSVLDFLTADFTFLNESLAKHYGIDGADGCRVSDPGSDEMHRDIRGPRFRRVRFEDGRRGGILRQASILTATSNPTRTSPVKRGHWVLTQLLGKSPPPPPPGVSELEEAEGEVTGTLRERMEQHRRDPRCTSCHAQMDPIGFAFENYDAIGRFRLLDGGQEIDATGTLPGGETFDGPGELIDILKRRRDEFVRCLVENMLTYALGRGLEYYDRRTVNEIVQSMQEENDRFSVLVRGIVHSEPFQLRRGASNR
jgi:hypothetical protein